MTKPEYRAWCKSFAERFGLNYDGGLEMLASWTDDLIAREATIEELEAVAAKLTTKAPDRREQWRPAVFMGLLNLRSERAQRQRSQDLIDRGKSDHTDTSRQRQMLEAGCFTRKRMRELGCSDADIARIEAAAAERRGGIAPAPASTPQLALFDPQTVPF